MQSPFIVDLTEQNFREVLEGSMQTPVLIHFWAPMSQESANVIPALRTLAQQYNGAFTLALLNCEQQQMIAAQFGVQALPTIALFIDGQPVDGLGGPQSIDVIEQMLTKHLPSQDELQVNNAKLLIQQGQFAEALAMLNAVAQTIRNHGEVKLLLAECLLETQQFPAAQALLDTIPLEYKNQDYKRLLSKLELHQQAADSPEIQALEDKLAKQDNSPEIALDLAVQYHQVHRDEDALALLWSYLAKDLNAANGDLKKVFMDILSALGQGNPIAGKYRRQLYSILY